MAERTSRFALTAQRDENHVGISDRLIAYVRDRLDDARIEYAEPPSSISGGFDTTIFAFRLAGADAALACPLILRLYRPESRERVPFESAVQNAIAAAGFPAPPVLLTELDDDALGGAFTVMPRVPGRIMLGAFFGPGIRHTPALFGRTHAQLHSLDAAAISAHVQAAGLSVDAMRRPSDVASLQSRIANARLPGLQDCVAWLAARELQTTGDHVVCHGDFHPLNILIDDSGRNVTGVIDWTAARLGDPAWDVGATVALMTQGPIDVPRISYPAVGVFRRRVVSAYLRAYQRVRPLDLAAVEFYEAVRCLGFVVEVGEKRQQRAGLIPMDSKPSAFEQPHVLSRILKRLERITGERPSLPEL